MPDTSSRRPTVAEDARLNVKAAHEFGDLERPITAPVHSLLTSPARSHPNAAHAKELPLHLILLILSYLDDVADLARITRSSRLFYYMCLPRLYEKVDLRAHSEIRYIEGRPSGYGSGSPFAMGINTLVSRTFSNYVRQFRVTGEWREHDMEQYKEGRVPDNIMVLQIALRAALDKMKNLETFAWELNTKPLGSVYQGLVEKQLTSLTIRCQANRVPRPTNTVPPMPNLVTLVIYDIDPLCYPDDFSLLLLSCKKLENLKIHWSPRMRENGEESVNLMSIFGRLVTAKQSLGVKRIALYNLFTRWYDNGIDHVLDPMKCEELTMINCMGSSNSMTVFLDDTWRVRSHQPAPPNLKMVRLDPANKEGVNMLRGFRGLERLYLVNRRAKTGSRSGSDVTAPATPAVSTPGMASGNTSVNGTPKMHDQECRNIGSEYIAIIQSHHQTMRHLLLLDLWQLSNETVVKLCQSCPNLEQLAFNSAAPDLESVREIVVAAPKLRALRLLVRPGSELGEKLESMEPEMHQFAFATETWRPEYRNLKYIGVGDDLVWKLGGVVFPPKNAAGTVEAGDNSLNAKKAGPMRILRRVSRASVKDVEIWGMDSIEFEVGFP